jgi:hypothetical protein
MASSPFRPDPDPIIEQYALDDLVSHDSYGDGPADKPVLEDGQALVARI